MSKYRVGVIGTGSRKKAPGRDGYAMAFRHADGYMALPDDCEIVACADIVQENADDFADHVGGCTTYLNYHEMLAAEHLDIVSICTWPRLHASMTIDACHAGVKAVFCEKPMAQTWGESRLMTQVAQQHNVLLAFNHQRRFALPMQLARDLLREGKIGKLKRMHTGIGNLYDMGTHWIDMLNFFNDESPAAWVIAQIDVRSDNQFFGVPMETQSIAHVKYRNGVDALLVGAGGQAAGDPAWRLEGEHGAIEIGWQLEPGPILRYRNDDTAGWQAVDTKGEDLHSSGSAPSYIHRAVADTVDALKTGREAELSARRALNATEVIFACYESSRRRARVDMPLTIDDSPLMSMLASGDIVVPKAEA